MAETNADLRAELRELLPVTTTSPGAGQFKSRTLEKAVEAIGGQPWGGAPSHRTQIRRELGFIDGAEIDGKPLRKPELTELRDELEAGDPEVVTDGGLPFGEDDVIVRRTRLEPGLGGVDNGADKDPELVPDGGVDRSPSGSERVSVEYVTQVHIHTTRFEYPTGWDREDHFEKSLDERADADIGTEVVFRGHRQVRGGSLDDALPEIDLSECELHTESNRKADRALSPVVGVILLWAIVSLVIAILAYVAFGGVT